MTIAITIDQRWGGIYAGHCYSWRLCLGFIAFDIFPDSLELILRQLVDEIPQAGGNDANESNPAQTPTPESALSA